MNTVGNNSQQRNTTNVSPRLAWLQPSSCISRRMVRRLGLAGNWLAAMLVVLARETIWASAACECQTAACLISALGDVLAAPHRRWVVCRYEGHQAMHRVSAQCSVRRARRTRSKRAESVAGQARDGKASRVQGSGPEEACTHAGKGRCSVCRSATMISCRSASGACADRFDLCVRALQGRGWKAVVVLSRSGPQSRVHGGLAGWGTDGRQASTLVAGGRETGCWLGSAAAVCRRSTMRQPAATAQRCVCEGVPHRH